MIPEIFPVLLYWWHDDACPPKRANKSQCVEWMLHPLDPAPEDQGTHPPAPRAPCGLCSGQGSNSGG